MNVITSQVKENQESEWKNILKNGEMGCSDPEIPRRSSRLQNQNEKNERVTRSSSVGLSSRRKRPGENQIGTVSPNKKSINLRANNFKSVYHGSECPSCAALNSIKEENMARLQHHYKHCACFAFYYRVMAFLETTVKVPEELKKESRFLNHNQAKELCLTASSHETCKGNSILFQEAADLSDQLLGPAETATFDCDHYEEYLKLLLKMTEKIIRPNRKENQKIINDVKILMEDIKDYLKPFSQNTGPSHTSRVKKWDEVYLELGHSSGDEEFGKNLREIIEPKTGEKCFFFPEKYQFSCHVQ